MTEFIENWELIDSIILVLAIIFTVIILLEDKDQW